MDHLIEFIQKEYTLGSYVITIEKLILALVILLVFRLFVFLMIRLIFKPYFRRNKIEEGRQAASTQLFKYFIYIVAILSAISAMGINISLLLAGSAALLVGVGLGLQQTFNDLFSGIILLIEGTIKVGDVIDIQTLIGRVKSIGLRTSKVTTRAGITIIVPNSKMVVDNVINLSQDNKLTRFEINVGVAYGSDVDLVVQLLKECAAAHPMVEKEPFPHVRFEDFGDSALMFRLFLWSYELWRIENVKSEIRMGIDKAFREHGVHIPFPQRDLHLKSNSSNLQLT